jgi:hypothetical protein
MGRWILLAIAASALAGWAAATASARILHYQVTVAVSGPGRVTAPAPDPTSGSIDCPGTCSASIKQQTELTLTATPDGGAEFTGWGGSCVQDGTGSTCTLVISGPMDVTAGFETPPPPPKRFTLSVSKTGTGSGFVGAAGGIDCGPTCSASFGENAQVKLLAVPDTGSTFGGWSGGGCSGTDACTVTIASNTAVTARFDHVDKDPPGFRTIGGSAVRGTTAELRFRVYDDSGKSRELLTILKDRKPIGRVTVPLGPVRYGRTYTAGWHVPRAAAKGMRLYCGIAVDAAGNASKRSCSALRIT